MAKKEIISNRAARTYRELDSQPYVLPVSASPKALVESSVSPECQEAASGASLCLAAPGAAELPTPALVAGKKGRPINNMGGTEKAKIKRVGIDFLGCELLDDDGLEDIEVYCTGTKKGYTTIRIPRVNSGVNARVGFIDQVSFTIKTAEVLSRDKAYPYDVLLLEKINPSQPLNFHEGLEEIKDSFTFTDISEDQRAVYKLSSILLSIFGFGVTRKRSAGLNFYRDAYELGENLGVVCIGGQRGTINVMIYGQGSMAAAWADKNKTDTWEKRLHEYLTIVGGKLSRIDIAADLFERQYSPEQLKADHETGKTSLTNKKPFAESRGDWTPGVDSGKTQYIGKRLSGKLLRVYDKGLQIVKDYALKSLERNNHDLARLRDWVRIEGEWHSKDRILALEMLINPGQYLAGMYPALNFLKDIQVRVETIKKQAEATVENVVQTVKRQYGKTIWALLKLKGFEVLREICDNPEEMLPRWAMSFEGLRPIDDEYWMTLNNQYNEAPF